MYQTNIQGYYIVFFGKYVSSENIKILCKFFKYKSSLVNIIADEDNNNMMTNNKNGSSDYINEGDEN